MKLDYRKIWDKATVPKDEPIQNEWACTSEDLGLSGKFNVKVLTGPLKIFNQIYKPWEKIIWSNLGYNIINSKPEGYFKLITFKEYNLYKRHLSLPFISDKCKEILYLDYNTEMNTRKWNRMLDNMRKVYNGVYIGEVYFRCFSKKYIFLGYFSLIRKDVNFDEKTFKVITPAQLEEG